MYTGKVLECDYPRKDILYKKDKKIVEKAKNKLSLPKDKKVIFYAPTWRDDEFYSLEQYKFKLKLELDKVKKELYSEYIVLIRVHYFITDNLDLSDYKGFVFDASDYDDIAELYIISDILITDYSSVFFDYANLKRLILFYTYDLDNNQSKLRGFYIDITKGLPGPLLFTTEEVMNSIKNIHNVNEESEEKYNEFYNKFCYLDDGRAS